MFAAIAVALVFVVLARCGATLIAFLQSIAVSLGDAAILLRRAVRVSVPAMWFAPATLFLSSWQFFV
jgi:hypothetical protein